MRIIKSFMPYGLFIVVITTLILMNSINFFYLGTWYKRYLTHTIHLTLNSEDKETRELVDDVDVSHWQDTIDWLQVYNAGYRFAFCKATEGTSYIDPRFATNMQNGKNAGLLLDTFLIVSASSNTPPVANAGDDKTVVIGSSVNFDASQSYDPDGIIVQYKWDFGDGATQMTSTPYVQHTYTSAGTYVVTLTVVDNTGLIATDTCMITVNSQQQQIPGFESIAFMLGLITAIGIMEYYRRKNLSQFKRIERGKVI